MALFPCNVGSGGTLPQITGDFNGLTTANEFYTSWNGAFFIYCFPGEHTKFKCSNSAFGNHYYRFINKDGSTTVGNAQNNSEVVIPSGTILIIDTNSGGSSGQTVRFTLL